jgi:hypothetical protein
MLRHLRIHAVLPAILAGTLGACATPSAASDDETGAREPESFAGIWTGTTSDGGPATLTVSPEEVLTDVRLTLAVDVGGGTCTGEFAAQPLLDVAEGAFEYEGLLENPGGVVAVTLHGSFDGDSAAGGYGIHSFQLVCGGSYIIGTVSGDGGSFELARAPVAPEAPAECHPQDCVTACQAAYACGLEADATGQLCPGFGPDRITLDAFLHGQQNDGCLAACEAQPALVGLVDACACATTVGTLEAVSAPFAAACGG